MGCGLVMNRTFLLSGRRNTMNAKSIMKTTSLAAALLIAYLFIFIIETARG